MLKCSLINRIFCQIIILANEYEETCLSPSMSSLTLAAEPSYCSKTPSWPRKSPEITRIRSFFAGLVG